MQMGRRLMHHPCTMFRVSNALTPVYNMHGDRSKYIHLHFITRSSRLFKIYNTRGKNRVMISYCTTLNSVHPSVVTKRIEHRSVFILLVSLSPRLFWLHVSLATIRHGFYTNKVIGHLLFLFFKRFVFYFRKFVVTTFMRQIWLQNGWPIWSAIKSH